MISSLKINGFFEVQLLSFLALTFFNLTALSVQAETLQGEVKEKSAASQNPRPRFNDGGQGADPFASGEQSTSVAPKPRANNSDPFSDAPQPFRPDSNERDVDATSGSGAAVHSNASPARIVRSATPANNRARVTPPQSNRLPSPAKSFPVDATNSLKAASPSLESENSPAMQLQWDAWHKNVAKDIYYRFNIMASSQFRTRAPMLCRVSYVVTRSGEVNDVRILQSSNNKAFDFLVTSVIKATVHKNVLHFPALSQRQSVERTGTFTLNQTSHAGFDFKGGDRETIHP